MIYTFRLNPNPVPTFLDTISPSFSNSVNLSLTLRVLILIPIALSFLPTHSAGTVASFKHISTAFNSCSFVATSLKTILKCNRFSNIYSFRWRQNIEDMIMPTTSYIYHIRSIYSIGELQ